MDKTASSHVAQYYDAHVEQEWDRLNESWLEFAVTLDRVKRSLTSNQSVLDIGGGPGRYALALAQMGHEVDLVDVSQAAVQFAINEATARGVELRRASTGDARDLSHYPSDRFDAVLCLGPLYHLVDKTDRDLVRAEVARVLRPGGVAFFAVISTFAPIYYACKKPERFANTVDTAAEIAGAPEFQIDPGGSFFTEAAFIHPDGVEEEFAASSLTLTEVFGAESLFAQSEVALASLSPADRAKLRDLAIAHAADKAARYTSEHIIVVMTKPA